MQKNTMSWFCEAGGGGVAGIAFVGSLCGSYNTNLNERQGSAAGTGFVSSPKNPSKRFQNCFYSLLVLFLLFLPVYK